MSCTDLQTDTATSATAGQQQEQKHPETTIPPFPCLGWEFILQPTLSNLSFLKAAAEHQQTRQCFAVLCLSQCGWAGSGCCVQRAPAPLPVPTVMLGTSTASPEPGNGTDKVHLPRSPHLIPAIQSWAQAVPSTPSAAALQKTSSTSAATRVISSQGLRTWATAF